MRRPRRRPRRLRALHPNVGIQATYKRKIEELIRAMNADVQATIAAAFTRNEPKMTVALAQDVMPTATLEMAMAALKHRWLGEFDRTAPRLAAYFATAVQERTDASLRRILDAGGFSVRFRMTPAAQDILQSTIAANVALIKSIPEQYLTQVEGMVMRSVQTGRDLAQLTDDIQGQFGVTRRRAALIARDQNNKATSAINRERQLEVGITKGIWMHSHGGKEPRPKHVAAHGTEFDVRQGLPVGDKGDWVMPGEEINCKCVWKPVIPGLT